MALTIGTQVGSHEIVALLGKGGMGEVYRARDLKLKREVAIKILPEEFARDADRVSRFQREAEVLASLNHPNIGGIHDFAEANGSRYLVLELVEGETLGDVIANRGALPVGGALQIGIQICEALEAAHEKGVIHRDLKPANIKVTPDGKVKVLDFGLAKAFEPQTARPSLSQSPTISMAATMQGVILGTAAYMSPEQAKGKEVDRRTDIFAFGAVLYEMLTGRPAFSGEDVADILSHVLRSEPDWTLLPANLPPAMQRLLRLCLQKDAKKRRQTATDVRIDIEQALAEPAALSTTNGAAPQKRSIVPWVAFAVAMLVAVALAGPAVLHFREVPPVAPLISTSVIAPEGTTMEFGAQNYSSGTPALSPDGKWIVFGARTADNKAPLWIRPLSSNTAQMLPGTDGATFPFWSPENRYVAFFAGGKLKKIDITGGPPIAIADASGGRGGSWSPEGIILFTPDNNSPLFKVAAGGGTPKPATRVEATKSRSHRFPWFLPDGRHFLFEDLVTNQGVDVVLRIGSLDSAETMEIGPAGSNAVYSNGYLLFLREDTLMAQPFDPGKRTVLGEAVPVAERVFHELNNGRQGIFTVSISGLLAYQTEGSSGRVRLSWFDRTGKVVGSLGEPGDFNGLELSPDRKSAAVVSIDTTGNPDIWVYDIARNLPTRFTFDPGIDSGPIWSPNGTTIVWSNLTVARRLLRKSADLKGAEEVLYQDTGAGNPSSWSPDGKFLLFNKNSTGMGNGVGMLPLLTEKPGGPLKPTALVDTPFNESRGIFSPDGHWVVYQSNESRQYEIYVIPFPGPGGKRQISTTGGVLPRWRHDGKEIFYVGLDNKLMAAEVTLKATSVDVGEVHPLPITVAGDRIGIPYDVSLDGQRILAITVSERRSSTPLTLIQNWTALLKK